MKYNPAIHNRRSIRLKTYDYSKAGLYFITFCVQNRELLFGAIENDVMFLNDAGKMIYAEWEKLPERFTNIQLHEFVVMPNHFHAILEIVGATLVVARDTLVVAQNAHHEEIKNDEEAPVGATLVVARDNLVVAQNAHPEETKNNEDIPVGATLVVARDTPNDNDGAIESNNNPTDDHSQSPSGATTRVAPTDMVIPANNTLGEIIGAFKSTTTVEYIKGVKNSGWQPFDGKLWQRNYFEQIIRNQEAYENITDYIINNPSQWKEDKFYRK